MSFTDLCKRKQERLGRQLEEKEMDFLKWMYTRHQNEQMVTESMSVYSSNTREKKLQC